MHLDVGFVRQQFPAFSEPELEGWGFFENAGGSYACQDTVESLSRYYRSSKVQPYAPYPASTWAGNEMDRAHDRWASALGVDSDEIVFGPSTSANTYVLAHAFGATLGPNDEVIVTNQDHEANTGAIRRSAQAAGAIVREWQTDPDTGLLPVEGLEALLSEQTALVVFPHCSNIIGQENDVRRIAGLAHEVGAKTIVDGVSYVPHSVPDVAKLGADVYLFSLYKVFSVHQGLMFVRKSVMQDLPNQAHFFNDGITAKRLNPAGPDHAQVASANGVLDYIERLDAHHFDDEVTLATATRRVSSLWRRHEDALLAPVLEFLDAHPRARVVGPTTLKAGHADSHRCPTVAFIPERIQPGAVASGLASHKIMASAGHFYAARVLAGVGVDSDPGVVRISFVHYTDERDISQLLGGLDAVLS